MFQLLAHRDSPGGRGSPARACGRLGNTVRTSLPDRAGERTRPPGLASFLTQMVLAKPRRRRFLSQLCGGFGKSLLGRLQRSLPERQVLLPRHLPPAGLGAPVTWPCSGRALLAKEAVEAWSSAPASSKRVAQSRPGTGTQVWPVGNARPCAGPSAQTNQESGWLLTSHVAARGQANVGDLSGYVKCSIKVNCTCFSLKKNH